MATFGERVEALTGFDNDNDTSGSAFGSTSKETMLDDWLTQGAREVIGSMPMPLLQLLSSANAISSGSGLAITNSKILSVTRNDGTIDQPCRPIDAQVKGRAASSSGYFDEATSTDPAFYIENKTLYILPAPTASSGSGSGNANIVDFPTPTRGQDESNFGTTPKEIFEPIVLYAAIKAAEYLMASEEDPELYNPILVELRSAYENYKATIAASYGGGARAQEGE